MKTPTLEVYLTPAESVDALRAEAREGLTATPKCSRPNGSTTRVEVNCSRRSRPYPSITPTRTERGLLARYADEIAAFTDPEILIELGSGSSEKTRLLLDAMTARGTLRTYVPQDVSVTVLEGAAQQVGAEFPGIDVVGGVVSDFTGSLHHLPGGGRRAVAFLGGTLGNLVPAERAEFLSGIAAVLDPGENLILGVGLVIDPAVLVPAYDDAAGVTAQFNLNVLSVLNKQLGANFPLETSVTSRSGMPRTSGSRCAWKHFVKSRCTSTTWIWRSPSQRASSCAPRSRRSSPRRGGLPRNSRPRASGGCGRCGRIGISALRCCVRSGREVGACQRMLSPP